MGEIADAILEGDLCQVCGVYMEGGAGYPRSCLSCGGHDNAMAHQLDHELDQIAATAKQHGWTYICKNNGWHRILRRGEQQIDIWPNSRGYAKWKPKDVPGHAKHYHQGLIEAITAPIAQENANQ